jgi:glycerol-3-phosphate acyltransferase PlsX
MRPALAGVRRELSPDATGGAIRLGLRGVPLGGHGSAGAGGLANAVRLAARAVEVDAVERTATLLAEGGAGRGALASETADGDGA